MSAGTREKTRGVITTDEKDFSVYPSYIQQVTSSGAKLNKASKWLNAVSQIHVHTCVTCVLIVYFSLIHANISVTCTASQLYDIESLHFVSRIEVVNKYHYNLSFTQHRLAHNAHSFASTFLYINYPCAEAC